LPRQLSVGGRSVLFTDKSLVSICLLFYLQRTLFLKLIP
jgi:hypothetical protein